MSDDRYDELLRRLETLERRLSERAHPSPPAPPGPPPGPHEGLGTGFDEKRIVDLIVTLTTENVERRLGPRIESNRIPDGLVELIADRVVERLGERLGGRRDDRGRRG